MGLAGGGIIGGRGQYAIRKNSASGFVAGTKKAQATAAAQDKAAGGGAGATGRDASFKDTDTKAMDAEFSSWRNNISSAQVNAIAAYTNGDYYVMNSYLRHGTDPGSYTKGQVKDLQAAFKHTLSQNVKVYRGTGTTDADVLKQMTTVGGVFKDKGAFSTSISKDLAKSWASSKPNAVVFEIELPKGFKNAAWVHSISGHKNEKEMLIKPGQNWKVVKELSPITSYGSKTRRILLRPV